MALRWGIISAGKISHDFVTAVQILPSNDHQIVAIAARSLDSAQNFAKTFNIPTAYEGYNKLAEDDNIDVVYIGALNPQHHEIALIMLQHGKHVLCEKPLTMNEHQTRHLIEIAKEKKLFLMEAIWSRCFPVYTELRKIIDSGSLGDIQNVYVNFGFCLKDVDRLKSKEMGGGTILDLGIYTLQFQQFVFKGLKPIKLIGAGHLNNEGIDNGASGIILYENNKTALMSTSAQVILPNEAIIVGTNGIIRIPEFWCPNKLITSEKTLNFELPKTKSKFNYYNSCGLSYEAEVVRQCIKAGQIESSCITHEESIQLAKFMDSWRRQVGVIFPEDLK